MPTTATITENAAAQTLTAGDMVYVLPAYNSQTRQRDIIDCWADTHMIVIKVLKGGDVLLDYDANGDGDVALFESRLVPVR